MFSRHDHTSGFGGIVIFAIVLSVGLAITQFAIVKKECEEAGEKKCTTKAFREINRQNHSIDINK